MSRARLVLALVLLSLLLSLHLLHLYIQRLVHPPLSLLRPVIAPRWGNSTFLCEHRISTVTKQPYCLHLLSLPSPSLNPPCHLLLIPGAAAHASQYHSIASTLTSLTLCSLHSVDLVGHGLSGGDRGSFSLTDFVLDIEAAAAHIQRQAYLAHRPPLVGMKTRLIRHAPIILLGSSQGGEVAYQALRHLPQSLVSGAVSMNLWLSPHLSPSPLISVLTHWSVLPFVRVVLPHVRIPLPLFLPFPALYSTERPLGRRLYEEKLRDPLTQWDYSLQSYLTLFLPVQLTPAPYWGLRRKRLLIVCGEMDPVIRWESCEEAWRRLKEEREGSVALYVWPGGVHQLLLHEGEQFARLIGGWIAAVSADIQWEWKHGERRVGSSRAWQLPEGMAPSLHLRHLNTSAVDARREL